MVVCLWCVFVCEAVMLGKRTVLLSPTHLSFSHSQLLLLVMCRMLVGRPLRACVHVSAE